ncbi:hypothetical protein ACLOJK_028797 [Asimina triloba]
MTIDEKDLSAYLGLSLGNLSRNSNMMADEAKLMEVACDERSDTRNDIEAVV